MSDMPTWEQFMRPTLEVLSDGKVASIREVGTRAAQAAGVDPEHMKDVTASGQFLYQNRVGWALSFLTIVGALERPSRGNYAIADAGRALLAQFPDGFRQQDVARLGYDPSSPIRPYQATRQTPSVAIPASAVNPPEPKVDETSSLTPTEQVEQGIARIHEEVAGELLERLQGKEPAFFEQAVVQLLLAMGYGGTGGKGSVTQLTHDGGIDGVIDQDVLGLGRVYIQAKRYANDNAVQRPDVQGFVGALSGKADGGVFITTSRFSDGAREYAAGIPTRIILIDGKRLTDLMIRYGVGVQVRGTYRIVEVDEDFFA
jgi:restriction system protein